MSDDPRRPPAQPHRVSNSFAKDELEVLAVALQRAEDFRSLPGGLDARDYEVLALVVQTALRGGDISGLVRSKQGRSALTKLELLRHWAVAELTPAGNNYAARLMVTERVTKMLARARLRDVIQAVPAEEGETPCA
jgi:hypothetical protein